MILTRLKMGHTGVSDIVSPSVTLLIREKESGKSLKHAKKNAYVVLLEVACTLSNSLNVQQF